MEEEGEEGCKVALLQIALFVQPGQGPADKASITWHKSPFDNFRRERQMSTALARPGQ